nr:unnamed protein product [Digitaria exilis]
MTTLSFHSPIFASLVAPAFPRLHIRTALPRRSHWWRRPLPHRAPTALTPASFLRVGRHRARLVFPSLRTCRRRTRSRGLAPLRRTAVHVPASVEASAIAPGSGGRDPVTQASFLRCAGLRRPRRRGLAPLRGGSGSLSRFSLKEKQVLALLSKLDGQNVNFTESAPGDANQSVHIVADEGLEAYLPLADMVDVSEEVKRLSKRLSKMQSEYDALVARLNSQSFVEKAPEEIVRGVREKASEAEEKISLTKNRLAFLQSTVST